MIDPSTGLGAFNFSGGIIVGLIAILLVVAVLLSVLFFEILAVYYASVLIEAFAGAAAVTISLILDSYFDQRTIVNIAGLFFFGAILLVALFLAAGYVTTFALFWAVLFAGGVFSYELAKYMLGLLSWFRRVALETVA